MTDCDLGNELKDKKIREKTVKSRLRWFWTCEEDERYETKEIEKKVKGV